MAERLTDEAVQRVLGSVTCAGINAPGDHPAWRMRTDWLRARAEESRLAAENAELRRVAAALVAVIDEACPRDCTCTFCRHALKAHVALMAVNRKVLDAK